MPNPVFLTCFTLEVENNRHMPSHSPLLLEVTQSWPWAAGELGEIVSSIIEGRGRDSSFFYIPLFLLWMLPCEKVMFATAITMSPWKGGLENAEMLTLGPDLTELLNVPGTAHPSVQWDD